MNKTGKTVARNASALMLSQVATWILAILLMIVLPRFLGATAVGQFHLANSIWIIVGVVVAFGMNTLLTKEIARAPIKTDELFGTSLVLRSLFYVIGFGIVMLYAGLAGYETDTVQVIFIIGIANFFRQISFVCRSSLEGLERMDYLSIGDVLSKIFNTVVSIILLFLGFSITAIATVVIGANLLNLGIQLFYLRRLQPVRISFHLPLAKWMLRASFPYLMITIFGALYIQLDIILISLLVNEEATGWYGAADQLFGTLLFIPTVFITAVFPALSRLYNEANDAFFKIMRKSFDLLLLLGVPIGLGILVIANGLVVILFGAEFENSGPILALMGIVLILTYQNMLIGKFLISMDRQNSWTKVMAVATIATIPLDLILIPWCQNTFGNGAMGGALAFIITESAMLTMGLWLLPRGVLGLANAWVAIRVLIAGFGMVAVTWLLRDTFIVLPIFIGAVTYVGLVLLLRIVPRDDWQLLIGSVQSVIKRFKGRRSKTVELGKSGKFL